MLRWIILISVIITHLVVGYPQSASFNHRETEQNYNEAPNGKIVSLNPEIQGERVVKQAAKSARPRGRSQAPQQYPSQEEYERQLQEYQRQLQLYQSQQQKYQSAQQQHQQYQDLSQTSTTPQYEQPRQYDSKSISPARQPQYQTSSPSVRQEPKQATTTYIPIIRLDKSQALDGSYQHLWETGNNIIAQENGFLKHISDDQDALVQKGNYTYTAPDGSVVWTSYTADEGGFKVEGSHIPTPPPIPDEIQRGLEQIYAGIKQQQEADAREAKYGKNKPTPEQDNSITSDNYPQQYRQYKQEPLPQQPQQPQPQPQQYQEQPQTYRPAVRFHSRAQRPQNQPYQQI